MGTKDKMVEGIQSTVSTLSGDTPDKETLGKVFDHLEQNQKLVESLLGLIERTTIEMTHLGITLDSEDVQKGATDFRVYLNWSLLPQINLQNNEIPLPFAGVFEVKIEKINASGNVIWTDRHEVVVDDWMEIVEVNSLN